MIIIQWYFIKLFVHQWNLLIIIIGDHQLFNNHRLMLEFYVMFYRPKSHYIITDSSFITRIFSRFCMIHLSYDFFFLPVIKLNFTANLGEILEITFPDKSQLLSSVFLIRWYTASGTWINEHSDKSGINTKQKILFEISQFL